MKTECITREISLMEFPMVMVFKISQKDITRVNLRMEFFMEMEIFIGMMDENSKGVLLKEKYRDKEK